MLPQCLFSNVRRIFTHCLDCIFRQSRKFRYSVLYNIRHFRIVVIRAMDNFHTIFQLTVSTLQRVTHKPNPARSVVIVGTWNATLSKGVYPQGS